ncbi:patatin-like phospholipase family protein [Paraburkholderia xenovorans]|uniref:patatin-like phospholipase family protein n=1 Tax=Paraburkholderia xenovorans TaxID=36873 RepID=UPI0038BAAFFC
MRCAIAFLVAGLTSLASPAHADTQACTPADGTNRPAVGLVLSGGGARGYAHIGVLKVLEENRIPVDCIAATSMGAVVGGLYASGMTAEDMQKRLTGINLADIAFDVTAREDLPQSRREDERLYVNSFSLGFGSKGFRLPVGLVQGNRLQALLQDWTSAVPGNISFDRLPIPYRAIATDLSTGDKVVLEHGSLPQAIRASMALPGLFAPADIDGRTLIDGGIVSNLPIETARDMGASTVIAVDIGSPLRPLNALASPADVMQQMIGILIRQNVARQRDRLQAGDVLIEPALGSLSFTDFANANQAIAAGAAAARAALPQLQHLALSPADYAAWRARHLAPAAQPVRITRIEIASPGPVPEARIRAALHVKPGDVYDPSTLNSDLLALSTAGDFDNVSQQLVDNGDQHTLVINAQQKTWGPNFLLFGLGLSTSSTDEGGFRMHLGYRRPWLTSSGLEGRVDATVGSDLVNLHAELRQPLSNSFGYYIAPYVEFERRYAKVYSDYFDVNITQYRFQNERAGLDFGLPLARLGDFRIGVGYEHDTGTAQYNIPITEGPNGPLAFEDTSGKELNVHARLVVDQLDDPLFARKGYFGELRVKRSIFASSDQFTEVYGKGIVAASYGRHSINASFEAGSDFGSSDPANPLGFTLGGFQHLSAYAVDQLTGDSMLYAQVTYMNQLASFNASPIRGMFVGLSLEAGNVWSPDQGPGSGSGPLKKNITFFTALTSSFGPMYLGVSFAPRGRSNFFFQLGHTY